VTPEAQVERAEDLRPITLFKVAKERLEAAPEVLNIYLGRGQLLVELREKMT
jgi:hypothetical protein